MKQDWLDRAQKELKDRPLASLFRTVEPGVVADAFSSREDFDGPMPGPVSGDSKRNWEICEQIPADDAPTANRLALAALAGGADGLDFVFEKSSKPDLGRLLDGVFLDMASVHFSEKSSRLTNENILPHLQNFLLSKNLAPGELRGSMAFSGEVPAAAIELSIESGGSFRTAGFAAHADLPPSEQLAAVLKAANSLLINKEKEGFQPERAAMAMHFQMPVGAAFLAEAAKFRAFSLLWLNLQKAWCFEKLEVPVVYAAFSPSAGNGPSNTDFIRSTTLAMSAVIGGCSRLTVGPAGTENFHRRIARNVQHLLKLESGFERVGDPAAGSFFVEKLTRQLAEAAWAKI